MVALSLVLVPWYPSGISYFVFGCVMLRVCRTGSIWLIRVSALNDAMTLDPRIKPCSAEAASPSSCKTST